MVASATLPSGWRNAGGRSVGWVRGIPTYDHFIEPLLRFLAAQNEPVRTKEVYAALADAVGLTAEDKAELLPSRVQPVYQNRLGWAHDRLKRAGYSESPRRGYWMLTPAGRDIAKSKAQFTPDEIAALAKVPADSKAGNDGGEDVAVDLIADGPNQSPQERIDSGVQELKASVAQDLLEVIGRGTPDFFEQLVLDVLHAMGYVLLPHTDHP